MAWFTRFTATNVNRITFQDLSNPYNRYLLLTLDQRIFIDWLRDNSLLAKNVNVNNVPLRPRLRNDQEASINGAVSRGMRPQ